MPHIKTGLSSLQYVSETLQQAHAYAVFMGMVLNTEQSLAMRMTDVQQVHTTLRLVAWL